MLHRLAFIAALGLSSLGCGALSPPLTSPAHGGAPWTEITSAHFTVRTDVDAAEGRAVLTDLEGIYTTFKDVAFPSSTDPHDHIDVALFARRKDYQAIAPPASGAFFISAPSSEIEPIPSMTLPGGLTAEARLILQHELTHQFLHQVLGGMPPWLSEGMAQYYSTLRVDGNQLILGEPLPDRGFTTGSRWRSLQRQPWIVELIPVDQVPPVARLLSLDRDGFYTAMNSKEPRPTLDEQRAQAANYGGAWALVHLLNNGPEPYRARFNAFIEALSHRIPAKKAWEQAFGDLDAEKLETDFREYLVRPETTVRATEYTARPGAPPEQERVMSDADVHVLWAKLRSWTSNAAPRAKLDLDTALAEDPSSPEVHYALAVFALRQNNLQEAQEELDRALAAKGDDPRYLVLGTTLASIGAKGGVLPEASEKRLAGLIERLSKVAVTDTELNDVAWYYAQRARTDEGLPLAERAVKSNPSCWECLDTYALLLSQKGRHEEALSAQELAVDFMPERVHNGGVMDRLHRYSVVVRTLAKRKQEQDPPAPPAPPTP